MTPTPRLFALIFLAFISARLLVGWLGYRGDRSPEARARALEHFSEESIDAGAAYHRAGFGVALSYFLLAQVALLAFMTTGLSRRLADLCLQWAGGRLWLQTVFFLSIALTAAWLATLPFNYYLGHVLEGRFGFSRQSAGGWMAFRLKRAMVSLATALLVGSIGYALVRRFPRAWPAIVPFGVLAMQFGLTFLHPRLVMPLFHDIRPLDDPATLEAVTDVAHRAGVEIGRVRVIDAGRYSAHTNAFFIGFGKFKDIYLYDTLVEGRTPEEVASTFAHEAGHWTRNHVAKGIALASAGTILACLLLYFGFPVLARAPFLKIGPIGDVASLPMLAMLASVAGFLTAPVVNTVSRNFEREADRISLELTGSPEIYLSGFRKLAEENLSFLTPHPLVVAWRHTHPPIVERLQAARDAVQIAP